MEYVYRIAAVIFINAETNTRIRQKTFDEITKFAAAHDVEFSLLDEEFAEIAERAREEDAVLFTIEEMPGMYKRKLTISIVSGYMQKAYGVFNEYGEIMLFSFGCETNGLYS